VKDENGFVVSLTGNKCPKGLDYGKQEVEDPRRTLTTTVAAAGLSLKRIPVRTSRAIPKARLPEAMQAVRTLLITRPVCLGEVIAGNFLGLNVDLVATRSVD